MSDAKVSDTSGQLRSLDTTNFTFSDLSSSKDTIWSSYFLKVLSEIPRHTAKDAVGANATEISPPTPERTASKADPSVIGRLSSLERKVANQLSGNFHRKFYGRETFRGLVAGADGPRFRAVIQDANGDKFEYEFLEDELPEKQRQNVRVGSPIVVHIGYEYRGTTKTNMMKILLATYEKDSPVRTQLIQKKAASWDF